MPLAAAPRVSSRPKLRRSVRPGVVEVVDVKPELPEEFRGAKILESCSLEAVPTDADLVVWLRERGLDTSDWGQGNTKSVKKLWLELKDSESGLELWQKANGERKIVRVTHVLRAKVCSPDSWKRGIFLFNTWQQYGDGRRRVRNGLLSEKLTIAEMPLEKNLHEVCARAVTQEEMQRVAEALFKITPGAPPPAYDPNYVCPIEVVDEYFCDHVVEVEASKSYPRLVTMYHLYTVDILCNGLPSVDFTTLEFDHPDEKGYRKLKYVHAWAWKEWSEVQRYLFEGSVMKERKAKGSFNSADALESWLSTFNLDLQAWGQKGLKSVSALWGELEADQALLEMWGRNDGAPLLMRVVHVLQLKVSSPDPRLKGKFLYNTWVQTPDGIQKSVNRLMSNKLSTKKTFDQELFVEEARTTIHSLLSYFVDSFFRLDPNNLPSVSSLDRGKAILRKAELVDHHVDVDLSQNFKGLCTLYHLYTVSCVVEGLPQGNFASVDVRTDAISADPSIKCAMGWCWVTWPQCLDMVHSRQREMEEQLEIAAECQESKSQCVSSQVEAALELRATLCKLKESPSMSEVQLKECEALEALTNQLLVSCEDLNVSMESTRAKASESNIKRSVPPSIVSELAEKAMVSNDSITSGNI